MSRKKSERSEFKTTFQPMGVSCLISAGQSIMDAAAELGISIHSDCGSNGLCGKCVVQIAPSEHVSPLTENETALLSPEDIKKGDRLACAAMVEGPLSVSVSESVLDSHEASGKTLKGTIKKKARHTESIDDKTEGPLGIAIDIGTTTLALYLCDLRSGEILQSTAEANPQRRFGEDVISRIAYCNDHDDGLEVMHWVIIDGINKLIIDCLTASGTRRDAVSRVTVVGNTTMQHLFTGRHPGKLGVSPFMPDTCDAMNFSAAELGLDLSESCRVYVFPVISGFIGGDTAGVMLSEKPYCREDISLIMDIGTNGEIILGNRDSLWVTSCATGPALEGAHIECGMRASPGAIETVSIDSESYRVAYKVIGQKKRTHPRGLCGSGIIDAVAEMVKTGLIIPSGRLCEGLPGVIEDEKGIGRTFVIAADKDAAGRKPVVLTLTDIRQVQLAKAALSTGIKLLMKKAGIESIDRLVLTGAFGSRFNWRNGVVIGMLPEFMQQTKISVVDNAAGRGAVLALLDDRDKKEIEAAARTVHLLELAEDPNFAMEFALQTTFPE